MCVCVCVCVVCNRPGCDQPATRGPCPVCRDFELVGHAKTYYCSQECFQSDYTAHAAVHRLAHPFNQEEWQSFVKTLQQAEDKRDVALMSSLQEQVFQWQERSLCRIKVNDHAGFELFINKCHRRNTIRLHPDSLSVALRKDHLECFTILVTYNNDFMLYFLAESLGEPFGQGKHKALLSLLRCACERKAMRIIRYLHDKLVQELSLLPTENINNYKTLAAEHTASRNVLSVLKVLREEYGADISSNACIMGAVTNHNLEMLKYIHEQHPSLVFTAEHLLQASRAPLVNIAGTDKCLVYMHESLRRYGFTLDEFSAAIRTRNSSAVPYVLKHLIQQQYIPQAIIYALHEAETALGMPDNATVDDTTGVINARMLQILLHLRATFLHLKKIGAVIDDKPTTPLVDEHLARYDVYLAARTGEVSDLKLPHITEDLARMIASFL